MTPLARMPVFYDNFRRQDKNVMSCELSKSKPRWKSVLKSKRQLMQEKNEKLSLMLNPPKDFSGCFQHLGHYTGVDRLVAMDRQLGREASDRSPAHIQALPAHTLHSSSRLAASVTSGKTRNQLNSFNAELGRDPARCSSLQKYSLS